MSPRLKIPLAVGCACAAAAAAWLGLRTTREDPGLQVSRPPPTASPSGAPPGEIQLERIRLSSRAELLQEVAALGFDEVMVLGIGRPVRLEHYATDHLHLRMVYDTRFGEVRFFQTNDTGITGGQPVFVRGRHAVRNGEGASWVERGYALDINPLDRRYVRALRWVSLKRRG